jgi:phosphoribosylformylglycinamidine synthase subunit PurQ / glutaminase
MKTPNIAVIYLPGNNCEEESLRAILSNGMDGKIVRWNQLKGIEKYDGYVITGGWAYEDRIRAGVIASKDPIIKLVKKQGEKGKPVLGICNGAQVLIETGMVPGFDGEVQMALAPNINPLVSGYYCTWVGMRSSQKKGRTAFTKTYDEGDLIPLPIAHGEGRFMTADSDVMKQLKKNNQIIFQYCDDKAQVNTAFPWNPNGSTDAIAALCNKEGNVMAIMPHPERASFVGQTLYYGEKRKAMGDIKMMQAPTMANNMFTSMKKYIEGKK